METLKDYLEEETCDIQGQILRAFQICVKYLAVFEDEEFQKICSLLKDNVYEERREARKREYAVEMYAMLDKAFGILNECEQVEEAHEICELLAKIDGTGNEEEDEDE